MSSEFAMCTTGTGSEAADFCVAVILCSHSGVESLSLAKRSCLAVMQKAMADTNSGPSDKALLISLADRYWLKNLPRQIFSACMKFGGNQCRMSKCIAFKETHTYTQTHADTQTYMNETIY